MRYYQKRLIATLAMGTALLAVGRALVLGGLLLISWLKETF